MRFGEREDAITGQPSQIEGDRELTFGMANVDFLRKAGLAEFALGELGQSRVGKLKNHVTGLFRRMGRV